MKDLLDMQLYPQTINNDGFCLENLPLAYAYIPYQNFQMPYNKKEALEYGTVFSQLNKPYNVYGKEFTQKAGAIR